MGHVVPVARSVGDDLSPVEPAYCTAYRMLSNALIRLSHSEAESWRGIATAAALVLTLCRRPSGFWGVPTNEEEVEWYFRGSPEFAFGDYDYGSFTITWYALLAFQAIYGSCPSKFLDGVRSVFETLPSVDGAYGKLFAPGAKVDATQIVESPRHTAFALLIRLRFLERYRPEEWIETVKWLLDARTEKRRGWSYTKDKSKPDEPFSTGACIAALAYFLTVAGAKCDKNLIDEVVEALNFAFKRLLEIRRDERSLWAGHLSNGEKDIPDSAKVIDLLQMPEVYAQLHKHVPGFSKQFGDLKMALRTRITPQGASSRTDKEASITNSATVNVLPLAFEIYSETDTDREYLRSLCLNVFETLRSYGSRLRLESADWALLTRGCACVLKGSGQGPLSEADRAQINDVCASVNKASSFHFQTFRLAMSGMPTVSDGSILYLLSRGSKYRGRTILGLNRILLCWLPYARNYLTRAALMKIFGIQKLGR